ncbi:MAG TPA: right-handed parallel beta-helix repeat-containing protein, partial [Acidimicrobiia bacterium]
RVVDSTFSDISSAAIQIGSNTAADARPRHPGAVTRDNTVSGNDITNTGRDYVDAAGIYLGFTRHSIVTHNHIAHVPWSGIAVGWGWGLLDKGSFPGLPGSHSGEWGPYRTDNVNGDSIVSHNLIEYFIENRWDGGAVYTTGQQGRSAAHGLVIEANVARDKRPDGGGNTFYTDGGSRYVTVARNLSYDNPIGVVDLGPAPATGDPLPYPAAPSLGNGQPYGSDAGGCTTFGDITYRGNSWQQPPFAESVAGYNARYQSLLGLAPYSADGFFDVCPYKNTHGTSYPTNLRFAHNHVIDPAALPSSILEAAGPL